MVYTTDDAPVKGPFTLSVRFKAAMSQKLVCSPKLIWSRSVDSALMLTLIINGSLGSVYTERQDKHCNDTSDIALIETNGVTPE